MIRDLEKQLAAMARMDRSFQASLDMIKRIEAGPNIGRSVHDLAMVAAASGQQLQEQIDRAMAEMEWHKHIAQSALRSSWEFDARDRVGVKLAMEAFLQNDRPLREAMADIKNHRAIIKAIEERELTARAIERRTKVLRNVEVHQLELDVSGDVDQPLSKLVVDVQKNLELMQQAKADQEDSLRTCEEHAPPEATDAPLVPAVPPTVYGERMMGLVEAIFSAQHIEHVFEPFVTDYRMEMEAAAGDLEKMRAIQALYRKQFALAVLGAAWAAFLRLFQVLRRS
jgi:hypothetical protein